jgi:hypothetical protein
MRAHESVQSIMGKFELAPATGVQLDPLRDSVVPPMTKQKAALIRDLPMSPPQAHMAEAESGYFSIATSLRPHVQK